MPITVVDKDGVAQEFAEGNSWHIDADRHLHLRSASNKQIASFAAGCWQSVGHSEVQA